MEQVAALKDLGNKALADNKFDDAISLYTDAIQLDGNNHVLYSNRSAAYAKLQKYELALQDAEKTVSIKPDWPKGYSRKGLALTYLNRTDEAIETYTAGLQIDPTNATLREGLADCRASSARHNSRAFPNPFSGPEVMNKLRNDPRTRELLNDPSYLALLAELQQNPNMMTTKLQDPRVMTTLGVLLNFDAEPMDTDSDYVPPPRKPEPPKEDPKPEPQSNLPQNKLDAKAAKEKGNEFYKKKDFENAIECYTKAISDDPMDITFHNNLAAVYFEMKQYEKCIEQCEKGIEIGRENRADFKLIAKAMMRIGNAYKKLKNWKQAKTYYEKCMSEHRTPEIKTLLSDIDKIIREEDRKAYVDPEKAEAEKEVGNEFFKKGDYASAVKHYSEAIRRNPEDPKLYSNRAACYTKLAAFDLGLKDCDDCVRLDPKFIKGWIRKGHILQGMQQPSKASAAFQKALELDANNAEALQGYKSSTMLDSSDPEKVRQRAMGDPEVQQILRDPAMRIILEQMQNDPRALQDHLKNPEIAAKIQKLLESGLIAIH